MKALDIKKRLLKKQLNAIDTINSISKEFQNLAKDGTVKEVSIEINKLKNVLATLKGKDFTDVLNSINNNQFNRKDLSNIEKVLNKIADKEPTIKFSDVIKFPTQPKDAIPVVLTDKDRRSFYDAIKMLPVILNGGNATEIAQKDGSQKTQVVDKDNENIDFSTSDNQEITHDKIDDLNSNVGIMQDKQDITNGNLEDIKENQTNRTQENKMFDSWGDEIGATMIDELMVSEKNRVAGGVFNGITPDTNFYTTVLNANATATILNSVLDLATTTDSGSSALVYTNSIARYIGGSMNHLRGIFRVGDIGQTNNTRRIGCTALSDLADSFYFQLSGTTFSIVANTTGLDQIKVDNGSFNGDQATLPMTDTFHTWEILYTNRRIQFYIDKVLVHTFNQTTSVICGTRHLRPFLQNINTGVGPVAHLYTQVLSILSWGNTKTQPKYYLQQNTTTGVLLKYGIGSLHSIVISGVVNNAVVTLYDGTSTAGTVMFTTGAMTNQTVPFTIPFNTGIQFVTGLFLTITAANCNCLVMYE